MEKKLSLSDKIYKGKTYLYELNSLDVKESVKRIKKDLCLINSDKGCDNCLICNRINEEFGKELS